MKIHDLIATLVDKENVSIEKISQRLTGIIKSEQVDVEGLKDVVKVISSDKKTPHYMFNVYDASGRFEYQAYVLRKDLKEGKWTRWHELVLELMMQCVVLEPFVLKKGLMFDVLIREALNLTNPPR